MTSNLACIGMGASTPAALEALIDRVTALGTEVVGQSPEARTIAWQDTSGARVVCDLVAGRPHILPTYAALTEVTYTALEPVTLDVAKVTVVGPDGPSTTAVTCQLEQRRHLTGIPAQGSICLSALGTRVSAHTDEAAFLASEASLLGTEYDLGPAPAEVQDRGLAWPPRLSSNAFLANGFHGPAKPTPHALMSGVVTAVERRSNTLTGDEFVVAVVRSAFGELEVCLSPEFHTLRPGNVLTGTVAVIGRLVTPEESDRPRHGETRREWRRRTGRE